MNRLKTKSNLIALISLSTATIIFLLIPLSYLTIFVGQSWKGVPLNYVDDSLYYYAQIADVTRGNSQVGNPYFFEHADETAVYLPVAAWLAAIPNKFGLSLTQGILFNLIFWSEFFTWSVYLLIEKITGRKLVAALGSLAIFLAIFRLIVRPIFMQVVFPFYVLFLLFFLNYISNPRERKNLVLLGITLSVAFYIYSYFFTLALTTVSLWLCYLLWKGKTQEIGKWLLMMGFVLVLISPGLVYLFKEISISYFWESLERIWLTATRLPSLQAFSNFVWIAVAIFLGLKVPKLFKYFLISGAALIIVSFSNVVTGKEMEVANHVGRFVTIFFGIAVVSSMTYSKKRLIILLVLVSVFLLKNNFMETYNLLRPKLTATLLSDQEFAPPIKWLQEKESKPVVIWANGAAGYFIPILSKNYTLYNPYGGLYLLPTKEMEERYLLSNYFTNLTINDIENDYRAYAGTGNAVHQVAFHNYRVRICSLSQIWRLSINCGVIKSAADYKGRDYFEDLYREYWEVIRPNVMTFLDRYHVSYIMVDKLESQEFNPEIFPYVRRVYRDHRFTIYKLGL